jgi:hypothetical protein
VGSPPSPLCKSVLMPGQCLHRVVWVLSLREHANFRARRCDVTETLRNHLRVFLAIPPNVRAWAGDHRLHPPPVGLVADPDFPSMGGRHAATLAPLGRGGKGKLVPERLGGLVRRGGGGRSLNVSMNSAIRPGSRSLAGSAAIYRRRSRRASWRRPRRGSASTPPGCGTAACRLAGECRGGSAGPAAARRR